MLPQPQPSPPSTLKLISRQEWMSIGNKLEKHHAIFYKIWEMGKPVFTHTIPTACVCFDKAGTYVRFLFNPTFWEKLSKEERIIVICHESLHLILNHGCRIQNQTDPTWTNKCLDIVVNHLLVRKFGFERKDFPDSENLCWVDTIFPNEKGLSSEESFEFYYNHNTLNQSLMIGAPIVGPGGSGNGGNTLDSHEHLKEESEEIINRALGDLSDEEYNSIIDTIEEHMEGGSQAGDGAGDEIYRIKAKYKKKKKWESVIKHWTRKWLAEKDHEQWARKGRRHSMLKEELMLPSEHDDIFKDRVRVRVLFYLDVSGSCWGYKDRFFQAALTLPKEKFDVRLFSFDTEVRKVDLRDRKVKGGGGTSFHIIEESIQEFMKEERAYYPEVVFVITDGMGSYVTPQIPEHWHWFLIGNHKDMIPKESKIYKLSDFE